MNESGKGKTAGMKNRPVAVRLRAGGRSVATRGCTGTLGVIELFCPIVVAVTRIRARVHNRPVHHKKVDFTVYKFFQILRQYDF